MAKKPSLPWTFEENQELENCIATHGHHALQSYFMVNLPRHFNGKRTFDEVMDHYLASYKHDDVSFIENRQVPLPNYDGSNDPFVSSVSGAGCRNPVESSSSLAFDGVDKQASANVGRSCNIVSKNNDPFVSSSASSLSGRPPVGDRSSSLLACGGVDGQGSTGAITTNAGGCNIVSKDNHGRSKWTIDEHMLFLVGLWKYGSRPRGKWVDISKHIVRSRTSTQIASHGNQYLEQLKKPVKPVKPVKRRRYDTSLFDITVVDDESLSDLVQKKLLSSADAEAYALHLKGNANPVPETGSSQRFLNPDSDTLRGVTSFVNQTTTQNVQQEVQHIPSAAVIPHSSEPSRQAPYVHSDSQHLRQIFHVQQEIIDHQQPETVSQRILNPDSDTPRGVISCVNQTTIQNPQMQIPYPTDHYQPMAPQICHIQPENQHSQNVVVEPAGNTAEPVLSPDDLDFLRQIFKGTPSAEVLPNSPDQASRQGQGQASFVRSDSQHSRQSFHVQEETIDHQRWQHIYSQLEQDLQQETRNSHTVSDNVQPPQQQPSKIIHEISSDDHDPDMPALELADTPNQSEESSESDLEAQAYKLFK